MPKTETIRVLGRGTNVDFAIDDSVPFEFVEQKLREYLSHCRHLYSKGTVTVNVGRRILVADQMAAIKGILGNETGLTVTRYWCPTDVLSRALAGPDSRRALLPPVGDIADGRVGEDSLSIDCQAPGIPSPLQDNVPACPSGPIAAGVDGGPEGMQLSLLFTGMDEEVSDGHKTVCRDQVPRTLAAGGKRDFPAPMYEVAGVVRPGDGRDLESGAGEPGMPGMPGMAELNLIGAPDNGPGILDTVAQSILSRGSEALIIKDTCRSGEVIEYPGDVVVFGDVNPGAEIVAGGDILVIGALRGTARAGTDGNLKAVIFSLNLESNRLQIGPHTGDRPHGTGWSGASGRVVYPQIAYLDRRCIFATPFERWCEEYR